MGHGSSSPEIENQGQGSRSLQKCVCYAIVYCGMLWVVVDGRHGTGSLGNQVIWVIFHVRVTGSSFWPGVRPEFFRFSKKCKTVKPLAHCKSLSHNYGTNIALPGTMQILLFDAGYKYSYLLTYFVEYSIRYKTEYSSSKKRDLHTPTHKSTFGVHYRTGSPGQLGLRVAGFLGHKMWPSSISVDSCSSRFRLWCHQLQPSAARHTAWWGSLQVSGTQCTEVGMASGGWCSQSDVNPTLHWMASF